MSTALASFLSAPSETSAVIFMYFSLSFFHDAASPMGTLFLPSASPNAFNSPDDFWESSHFSAFVEALILLMREFLPA